MVEWFIMCRRTSPDRSSNAFLRSHACTLTHRHPIITSQRDNRRLRRLRPATLPPLRFQGFSVPLCWQEVGTAPIMLGMWALMTECSQKVEGFKLGSSCFGMWLIGWYCCKEEAAGLSGMLDEEVNGSWWKHACAQTCDAKCRWLGLKMGPWQNSRVRGCCATGRPVYATIWWIC